MDKNPSMFFAFSGIAAAGAFAIVLMASLAVLYPANDAYAYAVEPVATSGVSSSAQPYNFGTSFENLISPFANFFKNIQLNGQTLTVGQGGGNGASGQGSASSPVNVSVSFNFQSYVTGFENWFYQTTGVHIDWLLNVIIGFISWLWWGANAIVDWIVGVISHAL